MQDQYGHDLAEPTFHMASSLYLYRRSFWADLVDTPSQAVPSVLYIYLEHTVACWLHISPQGCQGFPHTHHSCFQLCKLLSCMPQKRPSVLLTSNMHKRSLELRLTSNTGHWTLQSASAANQLDMLLVRQVQVCHRALQASMAARVCWCSAAVTPKGD